MTIRLCLDEDSSDSDLIQALRLRAVDVVSASEAGLLGATDEEQLQWCIASRRVIYSANRRDFYRIHSEMLQEGKAHCGIILALQQHYSVGEQMRRLLRLMNTLSAEEMRNHIEFLSHWHVP